MALELKITQPPIPSKVEWNYKELKEQLTVSLEKYKNLVYTEDNLDVAKKNRANLNKLKKAINDERIAREKEYLEPFNEFKAQTKEIISMIDEVADDIGSKLDVFEQERISNKRAEVELLFNEINTSTWVTFEQILDDKWLNKTTALSKIEREILEKLDHIKNDIETIKTLPNPKLVFEAYKKTLDLNVAIEEGQRMAQIASISKNVQVDIHECQESEIEALQSDTDAPRYTYQFEVELNKNEAFALANFCKRNNIKIKKI